MHRRGGAAGVVLGVMLCGGISCKPQPRDARESSTRSVGSVLLRSPKDTTSPAPPDTILPKLVKLEQEARAIAKQDGCASLNACRTAPVGWRGCGGPRSYVVFCAATTDTVALFRKLRELEDAERAYNATSGMMSTCELRMPPGVKLEARSCREAPAGP